MQYDVTKLRLAVRDALASDQAACEQSHQAQVDEYEKRLTAWLDGNATKWNAAATAIKAKVRKGQPISTEDLPQRGIRWIDTFDETPPPRKFSYRVPTDLAVVRAALDIVKDDTVTAAELQRLGVKGSTLRTVFELAGKDGAK